MDFFNMFSGGPLGSQMPGMPAQTQMPDMSQYGPGIDQQAYQQGMQQMQPGGGSWMHRVLSGALTGLAAGAGAPDAGSAISQGYAAVMAQREADRQRILQMRQIQRAEYLQEAQIATMMAEKMKLEKETDLMDDEQKMRMRSMDFQLYNMFIQAGEKPLGEAENNPKAIEEATKALQSMNGGRINWIPSTDGERVMAFRSDAVTREDQYLEMPYGGKVFVPANTPFKELWGLTLQQQQMMGDEWKANLQAQTQRYGDQLQAETSRYSTDKQHEVGMANAQANMVQAQNTGTNRMYPTRTDPVTTSIQNELKELYDAKAQIRIGAANDPKTQYTADERIKQMQQIDADIARLQGMLQSSQGGSSNVPQMKPNTVMFTDKLTGKATLFVRMTEDGQNWVIKKPDGSLWIAAPVPPGTPMQYIQQVK